MKWESHTESEKEDGSILIETLEENVKCKWLQNRVKLYESNGKKVHVRFLKKNKKQRK